MERRGVVSAGCWCVDRNYLINHWPAEEKHATILQDELQGGGSGSNMAVDLKRLGAPFPVEAIGLVGDDSDGHFLLGLCDRFGIDRRQMRVTSDVPTSITFVMTAKPSGKRTFFFLPGSLAKITPDHFDFASTRAAIAHLGIPGTMQVLDSPWQGEASGWVTVLRKAHEAGLRTSVEMASLPPARIAELARPMLPHLDFIVINDHEAGAVTGIVAERDGQADVAACRAAALAILAESAAELVVVHFPHGCVAAARDGTLAMQPAVRVPPEAIAGSNGAGDAFAAGILFGAHEKWPLAQSLALAHASAAASLRSITTYGSVEDWRACLALAAGWGWRDALT